MGAVVRGYIDILTKIINFPYSTCISSFFWQQHPYFFVHFVNVFSVFNTVLMPGTGTGTGTETGTGNVTETGN